MQETEHKRAEALRTACLANAELLLATAEREQNKGVDHVCFHLALLALEEIGKSILATVGYSVSVSGTERSDIGASMDDHVRKIFWALWGGMFRDNKFTAKAIEENRNLARTLHERRLESLYTDVQNPSDPRFLIKKGEAERLISLVRARLELEKLQDIKKFEESDAEELTWFFKATEDPEMRKQIFSGHSIKKLQELKDGKAWIKWLRETYRKHEEEMRALAEKEIRRQQPTGKDAEDPKYKIRIRIQTPSHSLRDNALQEWNKNIHHIKMHRSGRKDVKQITKSELYIDFTFPKSIPLGALYDHGFFVAKTFVISLNIATRGIFWWNVQNNLDKYYEEISDLEADKHENIKIRVTTGKRLSINWEEARMVLDKEELINLSLISAFVMNELKRLEDFMKDYAQGLTLYSKTDIHLRLEVNAFEEFYNALKKAMKSFGDWDGVSDFRSAVIIQFSKIGEMKDLEKILKLTSVLEQDTQRVKNHPITITEVIQMKIYCDHYLHLKAKEHYERISKEKPEGSATVSE